MRSLRLAAILGLMGGAALVLPAVTEAGERDGHGSRGYSSNDNRRGGGSHGYSNRGYSNRGYDRGRGHSYGHGSHYSHGHGYYGPRYSYRYRRPYYPAYSYGYDPYYYDPYGYAPAPYYGPYRPSVGVVIGGRHGGVYLGF